MAIQNYEVINCICSFYSNWMVNVSFRVSLTTILWSSTGIFSAVCLAFYYCPLLSLHLQPNPISLYTFLAYKEAVMSCYEVMSTGYWSSWVNSCSACIRLILSYWKTICKPVWNAPEIICKKTVSWSRIMVGLMSWLGLLLWLFLWLFCTFVFSGVLCRGWVWLPSHPQHIWSSAFVSHTCCSIHRQFEPKYSCLFLTNCWIVFDCTMWQIA